MRPRRIRVTRFWSKEIKSGMDVLYLNVGSLSPRWRIPLVRINDMYTTCKRAWVLHLRNRRRPWHGVQVERAAWYVVCGDDACLPRGDERARSSCYACTTYHLSFLLTSCPVCGSGRLCSAMYLYPCGCLGRRNALVYAALHHHTTKDWGDTLCVSWEAPVSWQVKLSRDNILGNHPSM